MELEMNWHTHTQATFQANKSIVITVFVCLFASISLHSRLFLWASYFFKWNFFHYKRWTKKVKEIIFFDGISKTFIRTQQVKLFQFQYFRFQHKQYCCDLIEYFLSHRHKKAWCELGIIWKENRRKCSLLARFLFNRLFYTFATHIYRFGAY